MSTIVVHVRDADFSDPNTVYIGRAVPRRGLKASPWSNIFRIGDRHPALGYKMTREDVIALYLNRVKFSNEPWAKWIREHIHELRGKRLACWCHPLACHGDVLAAFAEGR